MSKFNKLYESLLNEGVKIDWKKVDNFMKKNGYRGGEEDPDENGIVASYSGKGPNGNYTIDLRTIDPFEGEELDGVVAITYMGPASDEGYPGYVSNTKEALTNLKAAIDFINGDIEQEEYEDIVL